MLIALGIAVAVFLLLLLVRQLFGRRLGKLAERTATGIDDFFVALIRRTRPLLIAIVSLYLGSLYLSLAPGPTRVLKAVAQVAIFLQVGLWAGVAIDFWMARQRRRLESDSTSLALAGVMRFTLKLALWSVLILMALDNLGIDVTALVAGLGIGGVAVALALQNVLGDLLASLSIALDKPFVIGDNITVGDVTGVVESIGLKTTRLRSVNGEQVVLANGDLLKSRIRNWKRMAERRVVLSFGLPYQTPAATIERLPPLIRAAVEAQDLTRFERAHFKGFGPAALDFEAVYWVLSPDMGAYMDRQQAVNLALLRALEREGIELACPAQLVVAPTGEARSTLPLPPSPAGDEAG